jgi:predicted nucleic acid-binding protein
MSGTDFLLDTNVVIGLLSCAPAAQMMAHEFDIDHSRIFVSPITRIELVSFPELVASEELVIQEFLSDCTVLTIDVSVERECIMLRRWTRLKLPDAIIAATAKVHGIKLLTLDRRLRQVAEQKES